ncbi:MAG: cache domain-containing protein, partial [Betaproteobacteria bacterium]
MNRLIRPLPAKLALLYVFCSVLWIFGVNFLLEHSPQEAWSEIETLQQFLFAFISGGLLYLTLKRAYSPDPNKKNLLDFPANGFTLYKTRHLALIFVALSLLTPVLGTIYISLSAPRIEQEAHNTLAIISRMNSQQIENWMQEREADLKVVLTRVDILRSATRLQKNRDQKSLEPVSRELNAIRTAYHYSAISLLDSSGQVIASSGDPVEINEVTRRQLSDTAISAKSLPHPVIAHTEPFIASNGKAVMYFFAPLFSPDSAQPTVIGFILSSIDFAEHVFPLLAHGSISSQSIETLLVKRDQDRVIYLSPMRFREAAPLSQHLPLTRVDAPAVRAVQGDHDAKLNGNDYRNIPVVAA